nr:hypothetical protein XACB302_8580007 [Xanthomonas citri pv. citri]
MLKLFAFALLVGDQHRLARIVLEKNRAVVEDLEVALVQLPAVDQRQCQALAKQWPEFLCKVQGQAWPSWSVAMQKADCRVQTNRFQGRTAVVGQQGVEKRQQRIEGVARWAAIASAKAQQRRLGAHQLAEDAEIRLRCLAFQATQHVNTGLDEQALWNALESLECVLKGGDIDHAVAVVAPAARQDGTLVVDFSCQHVTHNRGATHGVVAASVLFAAKQHISGHRAFDTREKAPLRSQITDADALLGTEAE